MFTLEKQMTPVITQNLSSIYHKTNLNKSVALTYELPVKYRIIDIAIAYINNNNSNQDEFTCKKSFKYINNTYLNILAFFYLNNEVSIQFIKKNTFMDYDKLKEILKKLIKLNLIEQISRYRYIATEWREEVPVQLISIEAKLYNWREAIEQAEYNLLFSDYSFVALDEDRINTKEDVLDYFKNKNIGLITVSSMGSIKTLVSPNKNNQIDKRLYAYQRLKILKDIMFSDRWEIIK